MSNTASNIKRNDFKAFLERSAAEIDKLGIAPAFAQALRCLLTAVEYDDRALRQSRLNEAMEEFGNYICEQIREGVQLSRRLREDWPDSWKDLSGNASEAAPDDLGKTIDMAFVRILDNMSSIRDNAIPVLTATGYAVSGADELHREIEAIEELRRGILDNWPWLSLGLPSVDRAMVARSRAAILRGEKGEPIDDVIRRFGGQPL